MVRSVSEEPDVTITRWGVILDPFGYRLVGYPMSSGNPRVTSPIVEFDESARTARTESGRLYHLSGDADLNSAADLARGHMRRCGLTVRDVALVDVSEVALALAPRPRGGLH